MRFYLHRPWWQSAPEASGEGPILCDLSWEQYKNKAQFKDVQCKRLIVNHLFFNQCLVSKKGLYKTITKYCAESGEDPLQLIPRTFFLSAEATTEVIDDTQEFIAYNESMMASNEASPEAKEVVWILKPAAQTNCGIGIKVAKGMEAAMAIARGTGGSSDEPGGTEGQPQSAKARRRALSVGWIVQEYIQRPLLVDGRKFDIRCYVLLSLDKANGLRGFYYADGYVRTSCKAFSMKNLSDREAHLTNDAIQKHAKKYGQFEPGNKLSYDDWQQVLKNDYPDSPRDVVRRQILPRMEDLVKMSIASASSTLTNVSDVSITKSFELLGYDFMVTDQYNPVLIEINSNPCLEFVCPLLESTISSMLAGVFTTVVDDYFPPPEKKIRSKLCDDAVKEIYRQENKWKQVFP